MVYPTHTRDLLRIFRDHDALAVLQNAGHTLQEVRGLVFIAVFGGYNIFARINIHQKKVACQYINDNRLGPLTISSPILTCFVTSQLRVALNVLVQALVRAGVSSVVLHLYNQKQPLEATVLLSRGSLTRVVVPQWHIGYEMPGNDIPTVVATGRRGKTYPMFLDVGDGGGSAKVRVETGVTLKVYPSVMHMVKAHINKASLPSTVGGVRYKIDQVKQYVRSIVHHPQSLLCGLRVEVCIKGHYTRNAAIAIANRVFASPDDHNIDLNKRLTPIEYVRNIVAQLRAAEGHVTGDNSNKPSMTHKHLFARIFNAVGFWSGWWMRYIPVSTSSICLNDMPPVATTSDLQPMSPEVHEIYESIQVRSAPRSQTLISAITRRGHCCRGFTTLKEVAEWVLERYGSTWRDELLLRPQDETPREPGLEHDLSLFREVLEPIERTFGPPTIFVNHQSTNYVLFDVPRDGHCMFNSLSICLQNEIGRFLGPVELRRRLTEYYSLLDGIPRVILQNVGAVDIETRARSFRSIPDFWGDYVDVQAMASIYRVNITIYIHIQELTTPKLTGGTTVKPIDDEGEVDDANTLERIMVHVQNTRHWMAGVPLSR